MTAMLRELRKVYDCGYEATVAYDVGEKDRGDEWLARGMESAELPEGSKEEFAQAILYAATAEAAAS